MELKTSEANTRIFIWIGEKAFSWEFISTLIVFYLAELAVWIMLNFLGELLPVGVPDFALQGYFDSAN